MEEDLININSDTRNEKIKNFFLNNKNKIISAVIIFIMIIISVFSYEKYLVNKKKNISNNFNSIIIDYSKQTKEKTTNDLVKIIKKKDSTYSPLSLYFILDNNLIVDQNKINSLFDILIIDTSLDSEIKNLIIYKKALFNADNAKESDLLKILNPLINSSSVWRSHALYLMAEYFYAQNQKKKAKEFFEQIIVLENSNPDIKFQAEKRLNRDLGE
tara:strand:- start:52 stop:696 length:645 start_codon:yes stop_codon:yes gene_type:complete